MFRSIKTTLAYAKIELMRSLRDPITTVVLFGIPVLLVLIFGSLVRGGDSISVRVAVINNSREQFAQEFTDTLSQVSAFDIHKDQLSFDEARDKMDDDSLDGIIELPDGFGAAVNNAPAGAVKLYYDQADTQTGDIVAAIMRNVVDETNKHLVTVSAPITVDRSPINVNTASAFDNLFSMFTGMSVMMVGVFAVAAVFPTAKKTGVMRRLRATPIKAREIITGTMLCYAVIGLIGVAILTTLALTLFDLTMHGNWLVFAGFILFALAVMLGFGLAIGGVAKNSTQSDVMGQIVFIASLAVSGLWFPRVLMPDILQNITAYFPLTPVIEGIRAIVTEGATFTMLGTELAILAAWGVVVYAVGTRLFRWE